MRPLPIWQTKSGKFAATNCNGAIKYFKTKKQAYAFRKDTETQPRDRRAERYENRRKKMLAEIAADATGRGPGWLGYINPAFGTFLPMLMPTTTISWPRF